MSSCSTPWWAEYVSWQTAARMPRILLAATLAPTPEPQMRMPALGLAVAGRRRRAAGRSPGSRRSGPSRRRRGRSARGRGPPRPRRRSSSSLSAAPAWSAANATAHQLCPGSEVRRSRVVRPRAGPARASDGRPVARKCPRSTVGIRPRSPSRTTRATDVGDALGGEPEVLEDRAGRRRRAEVVEPDDRALVADPALPAERHADLDADAACGRPAAGPSSR